MSRSTREACKRITKQRANRNLYTINPANAALEREIKSIPVLRGSIERPQHQRNIRENYSQQESIDKFPNASNMPTVYFGVSAKRFQNL